MLFPSPVFFSLTLLVPLCLWLCRIIIVWSWIFMRFFPPLNMSIHHYRSTFNSKVQYISFEIVCVPELSILPCFLLKFFWIGPLVGPLVTWLALSCIFVWGENICMSLFHHLFFNVSQWFTDRLEQGCKT